MEYEGVSYWPIKCKMGNFFININRTDVKAIFDPLITDIERLVDDQVNLVMVKRMSEDHPKADQIKVISMCH